MHYSFQFFFLPSLVMLSLGCAPTNDSSIDSVNLTDETSLARSTMRADVSIAATWTAGPNLTTARQSHTATLLPTGKVLLVGGGRTGGFNTTLTTDLYDPMANAISDGPFMAISREYHTATLLQDGRLLVAGGSEGATIGTAEIYDSTTNTWSSAGTMLTERHFHVATLLNDGRVLVAGGAKGAINGFILDRCLSSRYVRRAKPCRLRGRRYVSFRRY